MGGGGSSLADQLYDAVNEKLDHESQHLAGKITGMLLEADEDCIKQMLNSDSLLQAAIERTKDSLNSVQDNDPEGHDPCTCILGVHVLDADTETELGDLLYERISTEYPQQAAKLTGMLLEMDKDNLKEILASEKLFKMALERALSVIGTIKQGDNSHHQNVGVDDHKDCVNQFGDLIYEKVEHLYPDEASKITGMLLELDKDVLETLLQEDKLFKEAARKAAEAISHNSEH